MPRRSLLRSLVRWSATAAIALLSIAHAAPARADDVTSAREHFAEGVKRFEAGEFDAARALFLQADGEHHAAVIRYNLARAEERLGHLQAAVDGYEAYAAEAGEQGELTAASTLAIAQIKARATRLRIESSPPEAKVTVDGLVLREPSPTSLLVAAGKHHVLVEGSGWKEERDIDAPGGGAAVSLVVTHDGASPAANAAGGADAGNGASAPVPAKPGAPGYVGPRPDIDRPPPPPPVPDGVVFGASFEIVPYYLLGVTTPGANNAKPTGAVLAGFEGAVGYAIAEHADLLAKGSFAVGPEGKPTIAWWAGPGISLRLAEPLWVGATFLAASLETRANDARYGTDVVFGAQVEASWAVLTKWYGQWMITAQPGVILTERKNDNTALMLPLSFGVRTF